MSGAIGTVRSLWRYPVKSMGGERVAAARVSFAGVVGDRAFALLDAEQESLWTARQQPSLLAFAAKVAEGRLPLTELHPEVDEHTIEVIAPDGQHYSGGGALATAVEAVAGRPLKLRCSERGIVDAFPLSILGLPTVDQLSEEVGRTLDPLRFRANLYIDWHDSAGAFFEDSLVGRSLAIGESLEVQIVKKDGRCKIISIDPESTEEHPEVLRAVAQNHGGFTGVYASVLREGVIHEGDAIKLVDEESR